MFWHLDWLLHHYWKLMPAGCQYQDLFRDLLPAWTVGMVKMRLLTYLRKPYRRAARALYSRRSRVAHETWLLMSATRPRFFLFVHAKLHALAKR